MKGVIFNAVEEVVTDLLGAETWDALLEHSGADGSYTALGTYSDEQLVSIVMSASEMTGNSPEAVLELVGTHGFAKLAGRYPELIAEHHDALSLLFTLEDVIHPQVKVLYPDAIVPQFDIEKVADNRLLMRYRSPRRLHHLACGLVKGAAISFGQTAEVTMTPDDESCLLDVVFSAVPSEPTPTVATGLR